MTTKPATPQEFIDRFPRFVYRDGKGRATVQWRKAALEMYDERTKLVEALHLLVRSVGADVFALSKEQRRDMDKVRALLREFGEDV